jgi:hypothetical protein
MPTDPLSTKSPLDAAQEIVSLLKGLTPEHQNLAWRFAGETLGLSFDFTSPHGHKVIQNQAIDHSPAGELATDIRSFTSTKSPKSDQQFAAVAAYFYQFIEKPENRKDFIDVETMKAAARLAAWPQAGKWIMTLNNAKRAGFLDSAGVGKFKLSAVGENLVAITLPANDSGTSASRKSRQKKTPKAKPKRATKTKSK